VPRWDAVPDDALDPVAAALESLADAHEQFEQAMRECADVPTRAWVGRFRVAPGTRYEWANGRLPSRAVVRRAVGRR